MGSERTRRGALAAFAALVVVVLLFAWTDEPTAPTTGTQPPVRSAEAADDVSIEVSASGPADAPARPTPERAVPTREIAIRVHTAAGAPLAAADVEILASPTPNASGPDALSAVTLRTGPDGTCRATVAVDRPYSVSVFAADRLPQGQSLGVSTEDVELGFALRSVVAYGVALIDSRGESGVVLCEVDGVTLRSDRGDAGVMESATRIFCRSVERSGLDPVLVARRMAQRELFVVEDGAGGPMEYVAHIEGYEPVTARLPAQDVHAAFVSPTRLLLDPADGFRPVRFSLRTTTGGVPLGTQFLLIRGATGPDGERQTDGTRIYRAVDPAGRSQAMLPPGQYEAIYSTGLLDWTAATRFEVTADRGADVTLAQEPGATLRVTDPGEPPLPVLLRKLARKTGSGPAGLALQDVWPTTGRDVVMHGLQPGVYEVEAWFASGPVSRELTLAPGAEHVIRPDE